MLSTEPYWKAVPTLYNYIYLQINVCLPNELMGARHAANTVWTALFAVVLDGDGSVHLDPPPGRWTCLPPAERML